MHTTRIVGVGASRAELRFLVLNPEKIKISRCVCALCVCVW
jgi:hypothetical protein